MPAPVIIVHQEPDAREMLLRAVRAAGHEVVGFDDPISALNAIEVHSRVRVLVTRVDFGNGKLNGVALVRMLHHNLKRDIKAVFVGRPEMSGYIDGAGEFIAHPADPQVVADAVTRLLTVPT